MISDLISEQAVLFVDDDDAYRQELVAELSNTGVNVVAVASGAEAIKLMEKDPHRFYFVVIDHKLPRMDGIETTRALVRLNRNLFVLVFTNVPSDDPEALARFKHNAYCAGACRYLEQRESPKDARAQVISFLAEMRQLMHLREWIARYYSERENVPSLLTQLDIGVDIIDSAHKVWFMNDAMRRITGLPSATLPTGPCTLWHGYNCLSCLNCLVDLVFETRSRQNRLFLSPLPNRKPDVLFYLNVWAQAVTDVHGNLLLSAEGRPLAVMESVQDITDSAQVGSMSIDARLKVIAQALHDRPLEGCYRSVRQFDHVRIMVREPTSGELVLRAAAGHNPALHLGRPVTLDSRYLEQAKMVMQKRDQGTFFAIDHPAGTALAGLPSCSFVLWPLFDRGKPIALVEASGRHCSEDSVSFLKPYALEVCRSVQESDGTPDEIPAEVEADLAEVDLGLQSVPTAVEALRFLLREACRLTESDQGHIRYREGSDAILLRLNDDELSTYERVATPRHPLTNGSSWSVRTILSGEEHLPNIESDAERIKAFRRHLAPHVTKVLESVNAGCFQPLLFHGRCIGCLCLQSHRVDNYADTRRVKTARATAHRVALALHDYLIEQKTHSRVQDAQLQTLGLLFHNIGTPIATANMALTRLRTWAESRSDKDAAATERLETIARQLTSISFVRSQVLRLCKPHKSRMEDTALHKVLRQSATSLVSDSELSTLAFDLSPEFAHIIVDRTAVELCLGVLLQNAVDAVYGQDLRQIRITLRPASPEDRMHCVFAEPAIAIDVQDSGPGVPSNHIESLFNVIKSTKSHGLGLGLYACRRVAKAADGDVYHHEDIHDGARFTLVLPYMPPVIQTGEQSQ